MIKHIGIAGNIGAGKTSLSEALSRHFGWQVQYEDTANNPYLADFYFDMQRWSFNLQVYFLSSRFQQIIEIQKGDKTIIQDRTIYEDAYVFAPNLHEMGLMSTRDYNNYFNLFKTMMSTVSPPDLLIYLKASLSTLVHHIQSRGRDYEGNISLEYLKKLNIRYDNWFNAYNQSKVVVIDADKLDFLKSKEDLGKVIEMVESQLHGLF